MASTFNEHHPSWAARQADWLLAYHAQQGERVVKSHGDTYLPITSGQWALGMGVRTDGRPKDGQLLYNAYLRRAVFPDILRQTSKALVGLMVREPWSVKLPTAIEYMLKKATSRGEPMNELIERILENVLLHGRLGLLNDIRDTTSEIYIADYPALSIINWDDNPVGDEIERDLDLVILDETRQEREPGSLQWKEVERYRLLGRGPFDDETGLPDGAYTTQVEVNGAKKPAVQPNLRGATFDKIPFTFVNATDTIPEPGEVPLLGLARLAMTIYRGEADYRHSLFMQGQDTLVLTGVANPNADDVSHATTITDPATGQQVVPLGGYTAETGSKVVIGAGAIIFLPDPNSDAKYVGVESKGLEEQRSALENDYARAETFGLALLTSGSEAEASNTIRTRVTARTASLASIVRTSAQALRQQLRWAAEWAGANPDEVEVVENLDFVDQTMSAGEYASLWATKMSGAPLSARTIHELAQRGDLTSRTLEEELEEIENEPDLGLSPSNGEEDEPGSGNANSQ